MRQARTVRRAAGGGKEFPGAEPMLANPADSNIHPMPMPNPDDPFRVNLPGHAILRRLVLAGLLIAAAIGLRYPGLDKTVWNLDEGSTFIMAEMVRDGAVLYRDAADNRTPLVPYAKALIFSVAGDWNIRAAHLTIAVMLGLTALLLWLIGRASGEERTGAVGAVFFTFLSFVMLTVVDTMSAHTGWFLVFFSSLGMWALLCALKRGSTLLAVAAGAAFSLAALAKQPGLLDWGVCLVISILWAWTAPGRGRTFLRLVAGLVAGLLVPLLASYWYFQAHGAWDDFLRYAWNYNTQLYVPEVPPLERLRGIRIPFILAGKNAPYALLLGAIGAGWLLTRALPELFRRSGKLSVLPWLILGWTASGLASTILSGRDFAHYSIQVLPGLSLACAWVTVRLWERSQPWLARWRYGIRALLGLGLLSLAASALHRATHFDTKESLSADIGKIITQHTRPDERIFVWGYEPELYVFSQRLPSTRFIYAVFLTGLIPWTNIDPLKDTTYAIVPGSWDDFWTDFAKSPPAMIVDTHGNRGFLKYPLRKQTRLWKAIENDYVEVTNEQAKSLGYSLYQHSLPTAANEPASAVESDRVQITGPTLAAPGTVPIRVTPPAGTRAVNLLLDGKPYRRVSSPSAFDSELVFFAVAADLPVGTHTLQAVTEGETALKSHPLAITISDDVSATARVVGPPIKLGNEDIAPFAVETMTGTSILDQMSNGDWQANAPTTLSYHRPPDLAALEFSLGFAPGAYDGSQPQKTDGVDIVVRFQPTDGPVATLYHRRLDPVMNEQDRGRVTAKVTLPDMAPGVLTLLITPGPMNIPAYDWTDIHEIKGDYSLLSLTYHGQPVRPVKLEAKLGLNLVEYDGRQVVLAHAPCSFEIPQVPGLAEISGEFGLLPSAWQGPKKSAGAVFTVEQLRADHSINPLFTRALHPADNVADREIQQFSVPVPAAGQARLRFSIRPADPRDNAFNHTFWHALQGGDFTAQIAWGGHMVKSESSAAPNGFAVMEEDGHDVLFAHAPSSLVFPLPSGARRLSGRIGLIRRAYTGDGNTDGATFFIESEDAAGHRTVLLQRLLQPHAVPADQGAHDFTLELPALSGGKLILRTTAAPTGRLDYAWSYWQNLRFEP